MAGPTLSPAPLSGAVLVLSFAALVGACDPAITPPTSPAASPTVTPPPATRSPSASPGSSPTDGSTVAIDPDLLAVLPDAVDGLPLTESPDAEAASLGDPLLARVASAFVAGIAVDPVSGDFVYAVVVRLLPDAMDATVFRDWRDTYDEGACSQAGGVAGHAETEIEGRTVHIGTCKGGLRTYHVWLEDGGVLVSASAVGDRRLGEQLVESLQP